MIVCAVLIGYSVGFGGTALFVLWLVSRLTAAHMRQMLDDLGVDR